MFTTVKYYCILHGHVCVRCRDRVRYHFIIVPSIDLTFSYTPGIYAEGYIVFVFPFVRSYVRSFVRNSFRRVEFASKFCVKVSQVVYISATTYQKAFIFGT